MKKWQIILIIALTCLFTAGCKDEDKPIRVKSPYMNRFLGEYDVTERYVFYQENFEDGPIRIDTIMDTTYNYKLRIEESKYECFDICLTDDNYFFNPPVHATIADDSTFFFFQQIPAYDGTYGGINGKGTVIYDIYPNTLTIKMNYKKGGPNQHGEHHYSVIGTRYK